MPNVELAPTENHISYIAGLEGSEYSYCFFTNNSKKLSDLFGFNYLEVLTGYIEDLETTKQEDIDEPELFINAREIIAVEQSPIKGLSGEILIPTPKRVKDKFLAARCFLSASRESEQVIDYFFELAQKIGSFFALPYKEVVNADNNIYEHTIERALEEGFVIKTVTRQINGEELDIIEISDKFRPL